MTGDIYETLLLTAQAVKSGLPFQEAIRLTVGDRNGRNDRKLLALADQLDAGVEPREAVRQARLPSSVERLLDVAMGSADFAGTFDELAAMEIGRSLTVQRLLQVLTYPFLLLFALILVIWNVLVFSVPRYEALYDDFGTSLPGMTVLVIQLSHWASDPILIFVLFSLALVLVFGVPYLFPRFWFCVPVLGHIFRCMNSSRMLRQLGNLIERNAPFPEALERCGEMMRNSAYRNDCLSAAAEARNGVSLPEIVVRYYWLFPTWLAPILATGGSAESLVNSFRRAAETVDQQKDTSILFVQVLTLLILILLFFSFFSFFLFSMFIPLIKLITELSG